MNTFKSSGWARLARCLNTRCAAALKSLALALEVKLNVQAEITFSKGLVLKTVLLHFQGTYSVIPSTNILFHIQHPII